MALKITHNIILDMQRPRLEVVHVMQDDANSRWIHADLFDGDGTPWYPPEFVKYPATNPKVLLRCRKLDGTYCSYGSTDEETADFFNIPTETVNGETRNLPAIEVCLAEQVAIIPGKFPVDIIFVDGDQQLSTFSFFLNVYRASATANQMTSLDYIKDTLVKLSASAEDIPGSEQPDIDVTSSDVGHSYHLHFKIPAGLTAFPDDIEIRYAQNASPTTPPVSGWGETPPSVLIAEQYVWTRVTLHYPDPDPQSGGYEVMFYSVARNGTNGGAQLRTGQDMQPDGANNGAGNEGSSVYAARDDHSHPINVETTGVPEVSTPNGYHGTSTKYARADHKHPTAVVTKSKTLSTTWTDNEQSITDNDFFFDDGYTYIVSPTSTSFEDYTKAQIYAKPIASNTHTMIFHCKKVPSSSLGVEIVRMVTS